MPRPLTSAMLTAIQQPGVVPALLVELQFVTGPVYVWSGKGNLSWNSHTWVGVGTLGGISTVEDGSTVDARGLALTLSGIDSSMLADCLQEMQLGLPVFIYLALFDSTPAIITDPDLLWSGRMDQPTIDVTGETATIELKCESHLVDMNVSVEKRYTMDQQQRDFPGDLAFQWVASLTERNLYWGRVPASSNNL